MMPSGGARVTTNWARRWIILGGSGVHPSCYCAAGGCSWTIGGKPGSQKLSVNGDPGRSGITPLTGDRHGKIACSSGGFPIDESLS